MSAVEVEFAEGDEETSRGPDGSRDPDIGDATDPLSQREITYRVLIRSVTNVLMVVLYMAFTLLRDRDSGVVVLDSEADDWEG
ncbi:MAG TPA: hypothetical protein ENK18_28380 [Deltaproteobacteria bacterium]|nr:hypothetical protein [Deltaproteobacteria bacterium]